MLLPIILVAALSNAHTSINVVAEEAQPGRAQNAAGSTEWIPFELFRDRWIFLKGRVNGVETDMMLDSGAGITVIDEGEAQRRGLRDGRRVGALGVGGLQAGRIHRGVSVEIDGLRLGRLSVASVDLSEVAAHLGRSVPLVLGRSVFQSAVVDIDYPRRRVAFRDPGSYRYEGTGDVLPLLEFEPGKWAVELRVEGKGPGRFQVDTGSGETLTLFDRFTRENALLAGRTPTSVNLTGGVGGMLAVTTGTLRSVELGRTTMWEVPAAFHTGEQGVFAAMDLAGNLGSGVLGRFRAIFDEPNRRLVLEPAPDADTRPFERDRSGLQVVLGADGLRVVHVAPGSPAARAGWSAGTVIRAVDGVAVGADYWSGLAGWNRGAPGTRVLLRDADGVERELVLADYF